MFVRWLQNKIQRTIRKYNLIGEPFTTSDCAKCYVVIAKIKGDPIEVFKILNGYQNIDSNIFFSKLR